MKKFIPKIITNKSLKQDEVMYIAFINENNDKPITRYYHFQGGNITPKETQLITRKYEKILPNDVISKITIENYFKLAQCFKNTNKLYNLRKIKYELNKGNN